MKNAILNCFLLQKQAARKEEVKKECTRKIERI